MGIGAILMPVGLALAGLGAGVGAGMALKPVPAPVEEAEHAAAEAHDVAAVCAEGEAHCATEAAAPDPFAPVAPKPKPKHEGELANVPLEKPFIVPVFRDDAVAAMMVASIALELAAEDAPKIEAVQPRLRDAFLAAMFRHANSGGFDGAFTEGRKVEDLRSALLVSAQEVFGETPIYDVLITEILRQDN